MKRIFSNSIPLILLFLLLVTACSKSAGPAGAQGAVGAVGPAGANGSVIYSGTGAPATSVGAVGDFYIDLATGNLYGPKASSGWGTPISLKGANGATGGTGATGAAGAAGSKIYTGTTAPASTLGVVGDYYLDKANYLFYGPKTAAGWGTPISLQGPTGPQGPEGDANVKVKTFSLTNSQWLWNSQYEFQTSPASYTEYFTRYADVTFNALTQGILDSGMVLVYFTPNTTNNTNQWAPLPYEFSDGTETFNYEFAYETNVGTVRLHFFFVQTVASATIPVLSSYAITTYEFKFVAVSGSIATRMVQGEVNLHDYNAVSRFTGTWIQEKTNGAN